MRNVRLWLASALMALLAFTGTGVSQPPLPKDGLPRFAGPPGQLGRLSVDDIVERIMSFDKNKDGKVTKDELPERMHFLIERGDTNKDGALDRDEIKKLATALAAGPGGFGGGGFGGGVTVGPGGPGPGIPGGFGVGGFAQGGAFGPLGTGPGPLGLGRAEEVVDDLKLTGKKKDEAKAAVKAHQENVRKLMDQA